MNEWMDVIHCV